MTMIARAFLFPRGLRSGTTRYLASIGKHQELNASESYSSFLVYAHGIDTRYPQDPNESKYVEHVQKTIQKWETLKVLESNAYSEITKKTIARDLMYSETDPCLAMFLKGGGLYDGTGFDDEYFEENNPL